MFGGEQKENRVYEKHPLYAELWHNVTPSLATDSGRWAGQSCPRIAGRAYWGNPGESFTQVGSILSNCIEFSQKWAGTRPFILTPSGAAAMMLWQSMRKIPSLSCGSSPFLLLSFLSLPFSSPCRFSSPRNRLWDGETHAGTLLEVCWEPQPWRSVAELGRRSCSQLQP